MPCQRGLVVGAQVETPAPTIVKPIFDLTTVIEPSDGLYFVTSEPPLSLGKPLLPAAFV